MNYDENNIFSKIIKKEATAKIVYEDDNLLCFYDINPVDDIHVLLIPKGQFVNYSDFIQNADSDLVYDFFSKADWIALNLLNLKEYKLITNNGKSAGQVVFHFHLHIIGKK